MAKHYNLVGSVYDKRTKKFQEEEIIKVPGVPLDSLDSIDKFTAAFDGTYALSSSLDAKYQNKNIFSIRVTTDEGKSYYHSAIYNNPNLIKIASSLKTSKVRTTRGYRTVKLYTGQNELFLNAWLDVEKKIIEKDKGWLYRVFGGKNSYSTLINRYITGDTFDSESNSILLELEDAFKEYEVFRKYLTNKDKNIVRNLNVSTPNVPSKTNLEPIERKYTGSINFISLNGDEDEDDYDKEEFFDEDEIRMMSDGDDNVPYHFTGRKI